MTDDKMYRWTRWLKEQLLPGLYGGFLGLVIGSPIIVALLVWGPPKGAC